MKLESIRGRALQLRFWGLNKGELQLKFCKWKIDVEYNKLVRSSRNVYFRAEIIAAWTRKAKTTSHRYLV